MAENEVFNQKLNPYDLDDLWLDAIQIAGASVLAKIRNHDSVALVSFLDAGLTAYEKIFKDSVFWSKPANVLMRRQMIRTFELKLIGMIGNGNEEYGWYYHFNHPLTHIFEKNVIEMRYKEASSLVKDDEALKKKAFLLSSKLAFSDRPVCVLANTGQRIEYSVELIRLVAIESAYRYMEKSGEKPVIYVGELSETASDIFQGLESGKIFYQSAWKKMYLLTSDDIELPIPLSLYEELANSGKIKFATNMEAAMENEIRKYNENNVKDLGSTPKSNMELAQQTYNLGLPDKYIIPTQLLPENKYGQTEEPPDEFFKERQEFVEQYYRELTKNDIKEDIEAFIDDRVFYRYLDIYSIVVQCFVNPTATLLRITDFSSFISKKDLMTYYEIQRNRLPFYTRQGLKQSGRIAFDTPNQTTIEHYLFNDGQYLTTPRETIQAFTDIIIGGILPTDLGKNDPIRIQKIPQIDDVYSCARASISLFATMNTLIWLDKSKFLGGEMVMSPDVFLYGDERPLAIPLSNRLTTANIASSNAMLLKLISDGTIEIKPESNISEYNHDNQADGKDDAQQLIELYDYVKESTDIDAPIFALKAVSSLLYYKLFNNVVNFKSNEQLVRACKQFADHFEEIEKKTPIELCIQYQVRYFPWVVSILESIEIEHSLINMGEMFNTLPEQTQQSINDIVKNIERNNGCQVWVYSSFGNIEDMLGETDHMKFINFTIPPSPTGFDKDAIEQLRAVLVRGAVIDGRGTLIRLQPNVQGSQAGIYGFGWDNMQIIPMPPQITMLFNAQLVADIGFHEQMPPAIIDLLA